MSLFSENNNNRNYTYIWAHRGASGYVTDNTLDAFRKAIEMGADGLESDVDMTKDGVLVFFHDYELQIKWQFEPKQISKPNDSILSTEVIPVKAETDHKYRKVKISSLNYDELRDIPLDSEGRTTPKVEDVFTYFKDKTNRYGKPINYSLDVRNWRVAEELTKLAVRIGVEKNVQITFNDNWPQWPLKLKTIRSLSPDIVLIDSAHFSLAFLRRLIKKTFDVSWENFERYNVRGINLKASEATLKRIDEIRKRGYLIYVWDCHDENKIRKFMELGVDAIYTNYPDIAVKIRDGK